jgi:DNA-binding transcriptional ArsR family regulator
MDNHRARLDGVFGALADPTRREVVRALGRGPASVSELAAPFSIALPSFLKHVAVLERSGLVRSRKSGRVRTCELVPRALLRAEDWLAKQRTTWEARTDRLTELVERMHREERRTREESNRAEGRQRES